MCAVMLVTWSLSLTHFVPNISHLHGCWYSNLFILTLRYDDLGNAVNCSDPNEQYSGQKVDLWWVSLRLVFVSKIRTKSLIGLSEARSYSFESSSANFLYITFFSFESLGVITHCFAIYLALRERNKLVLERKAREKAPFLPKK